MIKTDVAFPSIPVAGDNICRNKQPKSREWTTRIPACAYMFSWHPGCGTCSVVTSRVLWTFWALLALREGACTAKWEGHGLSAGTELLPDCAGCIGASLFPPSGLYLVNPARQCAAKGATSEPCGGDPASATWPGGQEWLSTPPIFSYKDKTNKATDIS